MAQQAQNVHNQLCIALLETQGDSDSSWNSQSKYIIFKVILPQKMGPFETEGAARLLMTLIFKPN